MARNAYLIVSKELAADKSISVTAKLLFSQLLDHRNGKTGQCNPRRATLARELGIGVRTIARALGELRKAGFIGSERKQYTNSYQIQKGHFGPSEGGSEGPNGPLRSGQFGPSAPATPLYESSQGEQTRARAKRASAISPLTEIVHNAPPDLAAVPRKGVGIERFFDPANGRFLSRAQMQQVGWAAMHEVYERYAAREREKERKQG